MTTLEQQFDDDAAQESARASALSSKRKGALVYRQNIWTRITHWFWALALFFLLLSGLQIFMARPDLYIGEQSGFWFDNSFLSIKATADPADGSLKGTTELFGWQFDTTGWLGAVWEDGSLQPKTFPGWLTIPSGRDLATGRVVHFFFGWILVGSLVLWLIASLLNGHIWRDLRVNGRELRYIGREIVSHARFRFTREPRYNSLQKLSYIFIMFIVLPLMIATGLTMSPSINAWAPWMLDVFGGRQTARTIHFILMLILVLFFAVHMVMVIVAGPLNELRSMITGWYRTDPEAEK